MFDISKLSTHYCVRYDLIADYTQDVLIIHGTADTVVPLSYSERALEVYQNAELITIEGAGHGFYGGPAFVSSIEDTVQFLDAHR